MRIVGGIMLGLMVVAVVGLGAARSVADERDDEPSETKEQRDARMAWWREARFGMFIHFGLYSNPAGEWKGKQIPGIGEWILHYGQIPVDEYEPLRDQFDPVEFDAEEWVRIAKDAGMKYIVITSKHHDGFCLFDSQYTDWDVMSTPFKRDILEELSDACHRHGIRMCWYHSIMDWHHPDYLPRRPWGKRPTDDADFDRYRQYLKNQVRELLTNYGDIGVMWFDGEWERTWTHEHGLDLYNYVRRIKPDIIVNNRVDKGRQGMRGMTRAGGFAGDFGTPEQEIPATGLPGVDWETCMTMNDTWAFKKQDHNWKSSEDLIRKLVDIASKGGNFLLNVGPTAEGLIPEPSVERLRDIGKWIKVNGEAIYGTSASPFKTLPWGRCTQKMLKGGGTRLYLHVFDWPADGKLVVPGLSNKAKDARILGHAFAGEIAVSRQEDSVVIHMASGAPDPIDTVVVLDIVGRPNVCESPVIAAGSDIFVDTLDVFVSSDHENVEIRYTTDGSKPTADSPLAQGPICVTETSTVSARAFRDGKPVSGVSQATFTKVEPRPAVRIDGLMKGLRYEYYEGDWDRLPDFDKLTPVKTGAVASFEFGPRSQDEHFGFCYRGYVSVLRDGVYTFYTTSDDGSQLYIGDKLVVDNDGLHGMVERSGLVALAAGLHPTTVTFFEKTGDDGLEVSYAGPGIDKQRIPDEALSSRQVTRILTPTPRQLAWQELEFHAFVHFGVNTFTDREWGDGKPGYWFRDWTVSGSKLVGHPDRTFGPVLCTQYTLSRGTLKMTVQMPPLGERDTQTAELHIRNADRQWQTVATSRLVGRPDKTARSGS